jgi:gamma-glutamylaminecyclotransferase
MASRNGTHTVFVYGTLKHGYGNHRAFLQDSEFVGKGVTVRPFLMKTTTGFPVVFETNQQGHPVSGELYEVNNDTLRGLDSLEGHPNWYRREEILVDVENTGIQQSAWMYIGQPHGFASRNLPDVTPTNGVYDWSRDSVTATGRD